MLYLRLSQAWISSLSPTKKSAYSTILVRWTRVTSCRKYSVKGYHWCNLKKSNLFYTFKLILQNKNLTLNSIRFVVISYSSSSIIVCLLQSYLHNKNALWQHFTMSYLSWPIQNFIAFLWKLKACKQHKYKCKYIPS